MKLPRLTETKSTIGTDLKNAVKRALSEKRIRRAVFLLHIKIFNLDSSKY